jgi:hypothetical protein
VFCCYEHDHGRMREDLRSDHAGAKFDLVRSRDFTRTDWKTVDLVDERERGSTTLGTAWERRASKIAESELQMGLRYLVAL